jgi:hypothetical protein
MATNNAAAKYMQGMDQASTRGVAVWFDQHTSTTFRNASGELIFAQGRPYHSIVELRTKMPVGPVMPLGWQAPVYAPQQYVIKAIGKVTNLPSSVAGILTNTTTDRIRIDYAAMREDDRQATEAHWREAVNKADAMGWTPPNYGRPMDKRLLALVGPAPRSPKIADAFIAGDPWILGMLMPTRDAQTGQMRVEPNTELERLLKLNRDDLMTPEEAEREEAAFEADRASRAEVLQPDVLAEANAMLAEAKRLHAEMQAMAKGQAMRTDSARPRGRPRKADTVTAG